MPRLSKIGAAALAAFGWTSGSAVSASYLVVAGGAGGGGIFGGGGGAGGLRTGSTSLNPTLSYTVTVGAGGAGGAAGNNNGVNGSDSVFNAITSAGGGYGGADGQAAGAGGSGGGASGTNTVGAGTSGQGNNGGQGFSGTGATQTGGGGGGASAVGATSTTSGVGGNGGNGTASSISGASVTYAGGGGGGTGTSPVTSGLGGSGGGGNANNAAAGSAGTANLGGGGGGGGRSSGGTNFAGGNGGSGVVIISYVGAQQFSGGVVTSSGGNTIHTFTTSGTLGPVTPLSANYLVVAGGGGTAGNRNGGGGAGGLLTGAGLVIDPYSIYVVTVGAGGAGGAGNASPTSAQDGSGSIFLAYNATGGGGNTRNGGSGGGANVTGAAGTGTSGQGFAGGLGSLSPTQGAGGGGGAGAVGSAASGSIAGAGGVGVASSISGTSTYYAGGGGGGGIGTGGAAGTGGGGAGAGGQPSTQIAGTSGTANTGGGAGGGSDYLSSPVTQANGGSGVVIISYAGSTQLMAGGVVTIAGGNVIHTFNSSGYLTPLTLLTRSLRFRSSATAYLSRTAGTSTSAQKGTVSLWVKRGTLSTTNTQYLFQSSYNAAPYRDNHIGFTSANTLEVYFSYQTSVGGGWSDQIYLNTTQVFRDPAAWYHVVVNWDTTQATASDRASVYVNGQKVTNFSSATYPTLNQNLYVDTSGYTDFIGYSNGGGVFLQVTNFDGYMAEYNRIDGQALAPTAFGTFNSYGVWQPITYGGSYGNNGFRLPFTNNASTTTLGYDFSPQGNNWTTNNISITAGSTYDSMTDVPTLTSATAANWCVLNPLDKDPDITMSNGNLTATAATGVHNNARSTMGCGTTGYWYMEFAYTGGLGGSTAIAVGLYDPTFRIDNGTHPVTTGDGFYGLYASSGSNMYTNGNTPTVTVSTGSAGDILQLAYDVAGGKLWYGLNNVWYDSAGGTTGNPSTGANATITTVATNRIFGFDIVSNTINFNFGQRPFTYTPPTGYLALNTFNL